MGQVRRGLWLSLAAFTSALALAVPASAQTLGQVGEPQPGVGNITGGDVTPEGAAPPMTAQARDKLAATMAWDAALRAGNVAAATRAENAYTAKWGGAAASQLSSAVEPPGAAKVPVNRALAVDQVGQINSFFCGPASGYMIIRQWRGAGSRSRFDNSALSQGAIGNANHMATTKNRVTDWASGRYVTGVNRWLGVNYYHQVHAPSAAQLRAIFNASINSKGKPFAADTVEFAGGAHYNGHPNRTIGHWITAYASTESGAGGSWADPSTTSFPRARPKFSHNTADFSKFVQSNGVAY